MQNVQSFVALWGLDSTCQQALGCLDPATQQLVMNAFQPTDSSQANQTFMSFIQSLSGTGGPPQTVQQGSGSTGNFQAANTGSNPEADAFVARWGLDSKSQDVLVTLDPKVQQIVMSDFQPPDPARANQIFMGFVKSLLGTSGSLTAFDPPTPTGNPAIDDFLAHWGLSGKAQELLCSLDPAVQQKVMSDFQPTSPDRANQMFMGFVKSVAGRTGGTLTAKSSFFSGPGATGKAAIDAFVASWGLDAQSQEVLYSLDSGMLQRVMSDFRPPDPARANQILMGFVKSLMNKSGGAPSAQEAYGGGRFFQAPIATGNAALDGFVAKWGLDAQAQDLLFTLDPGTQQRVMNDFQPPNPGRASQMFMGFVKSVASKSRAQTSFDGGGVEPFGVGNPVIDDFVAYWGLDFKSQEVLCKLDPAVQQKVMNEFQPPDISRSNQIFMGFVKAVSGKMGAPTAQQAYESPIAYQMMATSPDEAAHMPALPTGDPNIDAFVAKFGLDQHGAETLICLDQESQQKVMQKFNPLDVTRANNIFLGFVKSVAGVNAVPARQQAFGASTSQQMFSTLTSQQGFSDGFGNSPTELEHKREPLRNPSQAPPAGNPQTEAFVQMWGLDHKCQDVLNSLDSRTQQRVMSGFQATDLTRSNQMFMGFLKGIMAKGGGMAGQQSGSWGGIESVQPQNQLKISSFIAQWGLDFKCQEVLSNLDPETQQRVMSDFKPTDLARASRMFMGFVKSVGVRGNRYIPY